MLEKRADTKLSRGRNPNNLRVYAVYMFADASKCEAPLLSARVARARPAPGRRGRSRIAGRVCYGRAHPGCGRVS